MTFLELGTFFLPLATFLGTICLIALVAGSVLFTIVWIIKKVWKIVVTFSTVSFFLMVAAFILNGM